MRAMNMQKIFRSPTEFALVGPRRRRPTELSLTLAATMPKVSLPTLPVSALFGIVKPSGPSSMAVINDVKRLVNSSRLFVDADTAKENAEKLSSTSSRGEQQRGKWSRGRGKRRGGRGTEAKIGQGGTLDPLADGVLGE